VGFQKSHQPDNIFCLFNEGHIQLDGVNYLIVDWELYLCNTPILRD
jgi:hypothetical protein